MTDKKIINSIFPDHKNSQMSLFEKVDTISSSFLGRRAIIPYKITDAKNKEHLIVIKHKNSLVVPLGAILLSPNFSVFLKVIYAHRIFGFNNGRKREKLFYEEIDNSLRKFLPQFLGAYKSLGNQNVSLVMTKFPQSHKIKKNDLYRIIDSITDFHAKYYNKQQIIKKMKLNHYTPKDYRHAINTLQALFRYYYNDNVKIYGNKLTKIMSNFIKHIDEEYLTVIDHQTLTHNDLTPRNIYINDKKVIIYDWELACFQNPEHDLIELLFTTANDSCTPAQIREIIIYFREQLANKIKLEIDDEKFAKIIRFNALEYAVNRLAIYRSYSKKNPNEIVKRYEENARKVLETCL